MQLQYSFRFLLYHPRAHFNWFITLAKLGALGSGLFTNFRKNIPVSAFHQTSNVKQFEYFKLKELFLLSFKTSVYGGVSQANILWKIQFPQKAFF